MSQESAGVRGFDFFGAGELPAPNLPADEVASIVRERWGIDAELSPLGSQQDQNFLARVDGEPVGVVKITNPAFTATELAAQEAAAARIAASAAAVRIATTTTDAAGASRSAVAETSEGTLSIRGVERQVTATGTISPAVTDPFGNQRIGIALVVIIDRTEFGLNFQQPMPDGSPAIANEVTLIAALELVRAG